MFRQSGNSVNVDVAYGIVGSVTHIQFIVSSTPFRVVGQSSPSIQVGLRGRRRL